MSPSGLGQRVRQLMQNVCGKDILMLWSHFKFPLCSRSSEGASGPQGDPAATCRHCQDHHVLVRVHFKIQVLDSRTGLRGSETM